MSLLPRVFAAGKHLLTRSPLQMSLSSAAALLDIYKPYCNSVVWHAVENNRQEEAFVEAAAKLATLGRVTSVSFRCGTDTALKYKFSTAPYDIKRKRHHVGCSPSPRTHANWTKFACSLHAAMRTLKKSIFKGTFY